MRAVIISFLFATSLSIPSSPASAAQCVVEFNMCDLNGDGGIKIGEWVDCGFVEADFYVADTTLDNYVSRFEFGQWCN